MAQNIGAPKTNAEPQQEQPGTVTGQWKNDVCGFASAPLLCVNAMFCCPCVLAQTRAKLGTYVCMKNFKSFLWAMIGMYAVGIILNITYRIIYEITVGEYLAAKLNGDATKASEKVVALVNISTIFNTPVTIMALIFFALVLKTRMEVREKKQITGTPVNDCMLSLFCSVCTLVQTAREVDVSEECMNMKEPEDALNKV